MSFYFRFQAINFSFLDLAIGLKREGGVLSMEIKNIEAEIEVLGAMLYKNSIIPKCIESLREEDFYLDKHKRI